jgi:hypothetical protein
MANEFFESGYFEYAEPDFISVVDKPLPFK